MSPPDRTIRCHQCGQRVPEADAQKRDHASFSIPFFRVTQRVDLCPACAARYDLRWYLGVAFGVFCILAAFGLLVFLAILDQRRP